MLKDKSLVLQELYKMFNHTTKIIKAAHETDMLAMITINQSVFKESELCMCYLMVQYLC